ncbi:hypothetical protein MMC15_007079 [Xylographa vitiligo]|nr:hypothetical protein [Xylographa vitiligo]
MEAFCISAVQTLFGDRIAQKYTDHLNARWYANNNHRLEKALLCCQKLRDLAKQNAEHASALDRDCVSVASGDAISYGGIPGNAALEETSRGTSVSEGAIPGKNSSGDVSPVSDFPALTRTQTIESACTVPTTPVGPHAVVGYPTLVQVPSISPRQISDREPISIALEDVLPRSAEHESGAVRKFGENINLHGGLAWAGYGRKTKFIRRRSAAECSLPSNQDQFEIVEEKFEGNYPVHPSQMIGEGAFRIGRCADVDEALQELKRRLGPHIETVLQMTIRLLGKDTKIRGHEFTYHDLYCMLYEHRKNLNKPIFVVKTLDDGIVVQEGFPVKPVSLSIYPKEILYPTGDQIYRDEKGPSSAIIGDLVDIKGTVGDPGTRELTRTNRSSNVLPNVKPQVRFNIPETGARPPIPTARVPSTRQPRRRARTACDPKITKPIGSVSSSIIPKTVVSAVVTKDEAHGSIQQVQIRGRSEHKMDGNNDADHGLFSSPLRRQLGHTLTQQAQIRGRPQHRMDEDNDADHGLFSSPLRRQLNHAPIQQAQTHGHPLNRMDKDKDADHGLFSSPRRRQLDHAPIQQVHTHGHRQHKRDEDHTSDADPDLPSSPVGHSLGHPLGQRTSRITPTPLASEKRLDHVRAITTSATAIQDPAVQSPTVQNLAIQNPGTTYPVAIRGHPLEHSSWDYKERIVKAELPEPDLPEPAIANTNPVHLKPHSTLRNMALSSHPPDAFGTPSLSSKLHPLSYRKRHAPRVGSPLINVTNVQEHHSDSYESVDDEVPDFVDRSGESPAAGSPLNIPASPLPPTESATPQGTEEEEKLAGGIAAAIAAQKAKWAVRIPGSEESASSNACESF